MPAGTGIPATNIMRCPTATSVDLWSPFTFDGNPAQRGSHYIEGIGRLKDGVTPEQAQSEHESLSWRKSLASIGNEQYGLEGAGHIRSIGSCGR